MIDEQVDEYMGLPEIYPVVMEDSDFRLIYASMLTRDDQKDKGMLLIMRD